MALSDFGLNPYVDLRTGTLHNKVGARSAEELKERESDFVNVRMRELKESPVEGRLDFAHLKEIHHRLFQDVYEWAGQSRRNFDAAKQDYEGGSPTKFTPSAQIESEGQRIFDKLAKADHLQGLSRNEFIPELAKLHGELNQLHTFPEGNGRTQRLFLEQVAQRAGHPVDLSIGTEHRIIEASIAQTKGQHGMMERFIAEAADPDRVRAMRHALDHLSEVKGKDYVAGTYIASTVPGQPYSGVLYGKTDKDFILRTDDRKLVVGHAVDIPAQAKGAEHLQFTASEGIGQQIKPASPGKGLGLGIG